MDATLVQILDELYRKQRELVAVSQQLQAASGRVVELERNLEEARAEPAPEATGEPKSRPRSLILARS